MFEWGEFDLGLGCFEFFEAFSYGFFYEFGSALVASCAAFYELVDFVHELFWESYCCVVVLVIFFGGHVACMIQL